MVTDTGILTAISGSSVIPSFPGQQISVFSMNPETEITSDGLISPQQRKNTELVDCNVKRSRRRKFSVSILKTDG